MATAIQVDNWASMTGLINEIKPVQNFLSMLLFDPPRGFTDAKGTPHIEMDVLLGGRDIAPFVEPGSEALMVTPYTEERRLVEPPNIRIKRPMSPEVIDRRAAGTVIFPTEAEQMGAIDRKVTQDSQRLRDLITNSIEYLTAQLLTGTISYSVVDEANFTITFPRPPANNISAGTFWAPDGSAGDPTSDFLAAKELIADVGLATTHAIFSQSARDAFLANTKVQATLDNRRIEAGGLDLRRQFEENGALWFGNFHGTECWYYGRALDVNGVSTPLIRDKYVEFVSATPAAENTLYYGGIRDWKALRGRMLAMPIFSKTWEVEDPSALIQLAASRPLPCARRPGAFVSLQALA